jgi:hypothetical protein
MTQPAKYETNEPLAAVVDFLEKSNEDDLASKVIDVFAKNSYNLEQFNLIAKLYLDIRNVPKAIEYANKVLGMCVESEQKYAARSNLGKLYNNVNMPAKSLFHSKLNLLVNDKNPDTWLEIVFSLYLLGRKGEAEQILRDLKNREHELEEPHRDIVNFNLGTYDLEHGKFIEGMKGFMLKGKKLKIWFSNRELPYKFWDGGAFPGKTLILFAEGGGIGDEMLSVRFMTELKEMGFRPIFYTSRKDMYNLFNRCGFETIMNLDNIPKDSLWTYFMQVPIYLNSNPDKLLCGKYLFPSETARDKWAFIKESKKLKIGIRWQGNAKNERDLHRRVPLDEMMSMLHSTFSGVGTEVEYYSLQIGDGSEERVKYTEIIDVTDRIESYDDTLAFLENMDYVITSCTSVLHASAIVGTKTLALIPISAYFTWVSPASPGRDPNTSIWYGDNLRLFRQTVSKSWVEPMDKLSQYLLDEHFYIGE